MDYLIKTVFSKQNTFPHYREEVRQEDCHCQTKRQAHSNFQGNFCLFKFHVYLISYTRLFMKLNLFKVLLYSIAMKISRSTVSYIFLAVILKLKMAI